MNKFIRNGIICLIIGFIFGILSSNIIIKSNKLFNECTNIINGKIYAITNRDPVSGGPRYTYVEYKIDNSKYVISKIKSNTDKIGNTVLVHYNPSNPKSSFAGDIPISYFNITLYLLITICMYLLSFICFKNGKIYNIKHSKIKD